MKILKKFKTSPAKIIILSYIIVVFIGAFLLYLPISNKDENVVFLDALFTSVSAISVTGLATVNITHTFSLFGKIIILIIAQIGGLGFIIVSALFFLILGKKAKSRQKNLILQSLSLDFNLGGTKSIIDLVKHVLIGAFIFQTIGAILLFFRFSKEYYLYESIFMAIFHSISSFNNAGFALTDKFDSISMLIMMFLVILGGLGFFVWEDIWLNRKQKRFFRKLKLHSKLVLISTVFLIFGGFLFFYFVESSDHGMVINSFFQSIMTRSAGLSVVDQSNLTNASKIVTVILMLIGGSAGSTAGGIKNATAFLLLLSSINSIHGKKRLILFKRTINAEQISAANSILVFVLISVFIGGVLISLSQPKEPMSSIVFEVVSAVATVGLSLGITSELNAFSQIVIMFLMSLGRIGIITLGLAAFYKDKDGINYPEDSIKM